MRSSFPSDSPLHAFSETDVDAIFAAGTARAAATDEVIFTEGSAGDSMYFLLEGQAEARLHGGTTIRTYGPGSYFGELSFINPKHLRSATIVATTPAKMHVLDQASVYSLISSHPSVLCTLVRRTCAFLVDAERRLVSDLVTQNHQLQETIARLDFTRRRLSQEEELARTDQLTGLFNRRAFDAELPVFLERARAIQGGVALLAMDLDHFKPVNDALGHAAGDAVLRDVGKVLRELVRRTDLPCRTGGDEFVVLLTDTTLAMARTKADSIRDAIASLPHAGNERGIRVTATIGGTLHKPPENGEQLLRRADEALYVAKRAGRNRVGWT